MVPEKLKWKLYRIRDPLKTIPQHYGGPFRAWMKNYYGGKNRELFSELAKNHDVRESPRINEILHNFPAHAAFIGLNTNAGIVIIEGIHRGCALSLAKIQNIAINTDATIALADFYGKEIPIMGQVSSPAA